MYMPMVSYKHCANSQSKNLDTLMVSQTMWTSAPHKSLSLSRRNHPIRKNYAGNCSIPFGNATRHRHLLNHQSIQSSLTINRSPRDPYCCIDFRGQSSPTNPYSDCRLVLVVPSLFSSRPTTMEKRKAEGNNRENCQDSNT